MAEAVKFCLRKGLLTEQEVESATGVEEKLRLGARARLRMELYLKAHPEEGLPKPQMRVSKYETMTDEEVMEALQDESRVIWRRPKA